MESNGEINSRKWEETATQFKGFERDILRACVIGSLIVTSTPKDFARACETALEYMRGREVSK